MRIFLPLALAFSSLLASLASHRVGPTRTPATTPACHARPDLVSSCFTVHGALRFYNGAPAVRIWKIGSAHLLGVQGLNETGAPESPTVCPLPDGLRDTLEAGKEVIADFRVCPLTKERPSIMQLVCVDSASHMRVKPFRF